MKVVEILDYAAELGERFPDMSNGEVRLNCEEFAGEPFLSDLFISVVLTSYNHGFDQGKREAYTWRFIKQEEL